MEFIGFIKSLPLQKDKGITSFVKWASEQKDFPDSSNPALLADYLFDKLDWDLTLTYQKLFMLYAELEKDNNIPAEYKGHKNLLNGINIITDLKNRAGHNPDVTPSKKLKATRPFEYICFFPCAIPTDEDGDVYTYLFVDAYSGFLFITGMEEDAGDKNILKHINLLLQHKDFAAHAGKPFTLVLHKYFHLNPAITSLIKPFAGKMMINDHYVTEIVTPVMKNLFKKLAGDIPS